MNLIDNRQIRVFISSTFRDMQDERDELMKKTFPILRRKAAERDVTLTELDLRWGITPEESQSGKVVEICLREIENSEPFFVGIIGNRYGWIPSAEDLGGSLRERFSQVDGYVERRLSVTEMEMQFGVLERPEDLHAFFFIKEQETDDVDEPEKLAALKKAVRTNGRYPVSSYSSPEDLARQVEEAFTKLLDDLFPEGLLSELEKERIGQRAYLNSLCQNYIRTDTNFAAIDEWMSDWEKHQLVITGASGLGKSALVANWVKEKLAEGEGLAYKIIYHFVGNGGSLGSHGHVIKALCDEIRDRYGFAIDKKEDKTDEKALEELFNRVAAEGDKPLLIVLDAINQIIDTDNAKQLNWLAIPPKSIKIFFTTLEDDRTMAVFQNRHYPVFTLQPLTKLQREAMVRGYLGLYSKKLQPYQIERIVTDSQCENTLVLKTLLDELVNFGIFEKLDEKIGTYLGTESIDDFYEILLKNYENDFGEPFVKHILSLIAVSRNGLSEEEILSITQETPLHWSQFFCAIRQHLIVKNGLISFAHGYIRKAVESRYLAVQKKWEILCRKEIVEQLKNVRTYRAANEVPYQYDILDDLPRLHSYLLDIYIFLYLKESEEHRLGNYWRKLIDVGGFSLEDYLEEVESADDEERYSFLLKLAAFSRNTVVAPTLSLLFTEKALTYANSNREKADVLSNLGSSYRLCGNERKALEYNQEALSLMKELYGEYHPEVALEYNNVGANYREFGDYQKALEYQNNALQIWKKVYGDDHPMVASLLNIVSVTYKVLSAYQDSLECGEKSLAIRRNLFGDNHPDVAQSYNNTGSIYRELQSFDKALEYQNKSLIIRQALFGDNHPSVGISLHDLSLTYSAMGLKLEALKYGKKALTCWERVFGHIHPYVATAYHDVGCDYLDLKQFDEAIDFIVKSLEIESALGVITPRVAISYDTLSCIYIEISDYHKALEYQLKALDSYKIVYGDSHSKIAENYNEVGYIYIRMEDFHAAIIWFEKALNVFRDLLGENHSEVAQCYNNIGYCFNALGNNCKALDNKLRSLEIKRALYGDNHLDVAQSYSNVGFQFIRMNDYQAAVDCFEKSLSSYKTLFGEDHSTIAELNNNIGATYGRLGDREKELEFRLKALDISCRIKDQEGIATYLNRVGLAYKADGQIEKARDYFRQSAEKYRELGNEAQAQANLDEIENC